MSTLRGKLIRLAHANPDLRKDLLPLITGKTEKKAEGGKWIQDAIKDEGALREHFGLSEGQKIDVSQAKSELKKLRDKAKGDAKLSPEELTLLKQLNLFVKTLHPLAEKKKKSKKG